MFILMEWFKIIIIKKLYKAKFGQGEHLSLWVGGRGSVAAGRGER